MSSAPTGRASGIALSREQVTAALQGAAALAITAGFGFLAVRNFEQIRRLLWRPEEVERMLGEAGGLAAHYPARFLLLVGGSVAVMMAAEYRPRIFLVASTAVWLVLGCVGTAAYLMSTFGGSTRWALGCLLAVAVAITAVVLVRVRPHLPEPAEPIQPLRQRLTRLLLPLVVGLSAGLLAVRASIEPVTEWDAVVYHASFARDWIASLPGLPHAAGPSIGSELSYNYPALFPSITVAVAAPLHIDASTVARLLSPLAAITIFAVLRGSVHRSGFSAWAPAMFLCGSTFFVAYSQWPTAYMVMTLLIVLAISRILVDGRLRPIAALCLGLGAETGLIGLVFTAIILLGYAGWRLLRVPRSPIRRTSAGQAREGALCVVLLVLPTIVVAVSSMRRTGGLFFPWVSWPHAGHLLPHMYWSSAEREILANSYGQFNAAIGSFIAPLHGIATSHLLAPGGLLLEGAIAVLCGIAFARRSGVLLLGVAGGVATLLLLVLGRLVWLRYFLPLTVAAAVALGVAIAALREQRGGWITFLPYGVAVIAAGASLASGVAYGIAGPNDRGYTALGNYRLERSSAFETVRQAADAKARRDAVYGDDSRAWDDISKLDAAGLDVGTFDIRNYFSPYRPSLQLDGLAGASITGSTPAAVSQDLKAHGIEFVFVPSWFWEPGPARDPLADRSPVTLWVGSRPLRSVRVYLPNENTLYPSVLYAVGSDASVKRRVEAVLGAPRTSVEGPLSLKKTTHRGAVALSGLIGGPVHWRIAAPVTEGAGPAIRLASEDVESAVGVSAYEPRQPTLVEPAAFVDCSRVPVWARQSTLDLAFPGSPIGFASLDVGVSGGPRTFRAVLRDLPKGPARPLIRACGDPTSARGGVFPARSNAGRIIVDVPAGGSRTLTFDYLDSGTGAVSFNVYDDDRGRWLYKVAHLARCDRGGWRHAALPLAKLPVRPPAGALLELGPVVTGGDLVVRNLRLGRADGRSATPC